MRIQNSPIYAESWNVAYRTAVNGGILTDRKEPFSVIPNSYSSWAADPFLFEYEGKTFLFAELYDYRLCRGTIGFTELSASGTTGWKQVIVEPFHMSYPMLFVQNGDVFMLPETSEAKELRLYRAVSFPEQWELYRVVKTGVEWVDTTLLETETAFLGYTRSLDNIGYRFQMNSDFVVTKIDALPEESLPSYRNAGAFIKTENGVLRPCQEFGNDYGTALIFRQYDESCENEQQAIRIAPDELRFRQRVYLQGMHTYACTGKFEVIDIKTRRFNLLNFLNRIREKIKKTRV